MEGVNGNGMTSKQVLHRPSWTVAHTEPNALWRMAEECAACPKIGIFRYDDEPIGFGVIPNFDVRGIIQSDLENMHAIGEDISQPIGKSW
jgi:hypothetical protein